MLRTSLYGSRPKSAEMETVAQCCASVVDSFHIHNFPHIMVDPSAFPRIFTVSLLRAQGVEFSEKAKMGVGGGAKFLTMFLGERVSKGSPRFFRGGGQFQCT